MTKGLGKARRLAASTLAFVLLLALAVPGAAWADEATGGEVDLGVEVAERVDEAEAGDTGEVELGAAVGFQKLTPNDKTGGSTGWVEIGCAVGLNEVDPGTWQVVFHAGTGAFDGGAVTSAFRVPRGAPVGKPVPAPKRTGWQFAGWHEAADGYDPDAGLPEGFDPEGESAVPVGEAWDFSRPVPDDLVLYARWEIRLDVTVPVAVGVAINADTREVTTPDPGKYAVKSRTVRPVAVEEAATATIEAEAKGVFRLAEGMLDEGARREDELRAWTWALQDTRLSLASEKAPGSPLLLDFASDTPSVGEDGSASWGYGWSPADSGLEDAFTVPAFRYDRVPFDEGWVGGERCERLGFALGMKVSNDLDVRLDIDGPRPVTRLKLTVSAQM